MNWLDLTSEPSINVVLLPLLGHATAIANSLTTQPKREPRYAHST